MSTSWKIKLALSYHDRLHSVQDSYDYMQQQQQQSVIVPLINIRFSYKQETLIFNVQRREIVTEPLQNPLISPCFSCPIDPQLIAHPRYLSLLCNYLLNFINWCDPDLDFTLRLDLARIIADSIISRTSSFCEMNAYVKIIEKELLTLDGDVLTMDGGNVVIAGESGRRDDSGSGTGASRAAMNKLMKERRFYYHNGSGAGEECSICFENYKEGILAIKMPCLHIFHQNCVIRWLKTKNSCPLCRQTI